MQSLFYHLSDFVLEKNFLKEDSMFICLVIELYLII